MSKVLSVVNAEGELERSNYRRTILRNPGRACARSLLFHVVSFTIIRLFSLPCCFILSFFLFSIFFLSLSLSSTRPFTRHSTFVRSPSRFASCNCTFQYARVHTSNLVALTHFSLLHIPSHVQPCPGLFTSQVRNIVCCTRCLYFVILCSLITAYIHTCIHDLCTFYLYTLINEINTLNHLL